MILASLEGIPTDGGQTSATRHYLLLVSDYRVVAIAAPGRNHPSPLSPADLRGYYMILTWTQRDQVTQPLILSYSTNVMLSDTEILLMSTLHDSPATSCGRRFSY